MPKDTPAPNVAPKTGEERLTVDELAALTGNVTEASAAIRTKARGFRRKAYSWQHNAAAQLHGWSLHAMHSADPMRITRAAYEAALKAAEAPVVRVVKDGRTARYEPHPAACSPFLTKKEAS